MHGSEGGNGDFCYAPGNKPHRTGQNGFAPWLARVYAEQGYVTLALCYFDCRHHEGYSDYPPDDLVNVDIKSITENAIAWLRKQKFVGEHKVGLLGISRGAEQAILLASLSTPDSAGTPDAVASLSPSDRVMYQITRENAEAKNRGDYVNWTKKPAWIYGKHTPTVGDPIAIENYKKPLLVTFFWSDPVWGGEDDLSKTILRYENADRDHFYRKIGRDNIDKSTLHDISLTSSDAIFIEYDFSGHVYPDRVREPDALRLQIQIIDWFFNAHLKNECCP